MRDLFGDTTLIARAGIPVPIERIVQDAMSQGCRHVMLEQYRDYRPHLDVCLQVRSLGYSSIAVTPRGVLFDINSRSQVDA